MNIEETKEAIRVMQAYVDGKEVQCLAPYKEWITTDQPAWNFPSYIYRIKPTAKLRPWTADEVPLGAWIRFKKAPYDRHLLGWVSGQADRELWLEEREHSTDGGKTWLPCGVVEESKCDTPRTDAHNWNEVMDFSKQLERELAAAQQRIKRLEEAGDKAILNSYLPDRIAVWDKAKEAKP